MTEAVAEKMLELTELQKQGKYKCVKATISARIKIYLYSESTTIHLYKTHNMMNGHNSIKIYIIIEYA